MLPEEKELNQGNSSIDNTDENEANNSEPTSPGQGVEKEMSSPHRSHVKNESDVFARPESQETREEAVESSKDLNDLFSWSRITSRFELQNLPPPPKLISTVTRNGTSNPCSTERHPSMPFGERRNFPLTAGNFGLVGFLDHRIPSLSESIPVRASLDGLREVSLNLRHISEHHRDSSLCPRIPQLTPVPQMDGSHFFLHSHPFLTPHPQQDCLSNLTNEEQESKRLIDGDETKYKCEICNSSFTLQRLLNRHMKTHSFYKRYHCQFCTKGFNDTFDLKRHIRTHTGIKPFKCSRCDKSFTQRCSLEAHLTRVHGVVHKFGFRERRSKMFVCEDCGSTFTENSDFMKHVHEFHPETEKVMRARRNGGFNAKIKWKDSRNFKVIAPRNIHILFIVMENSGFLFTTAPASKVLALRRWKRN